MRLVAQFDKLQSDLLVACQRYYGHHLVAIAVFGSVGRGTPGPDSDLDVLIVAEELPQGRMARVTEFARVEEALSSQLVEVRAAGVATDLSPVFKTPAEVEQGSPLFLDMVEDARILFDRNQFLGKAFTKLRARLKSLGGHRIWQGNAWYWDLKPDYRPGEVFEL